MSSWFGFTRWPERAARLLVMEIASSMPRMAAASATLVSAGTSARPDALLGKPTKSGIVRAISPPSRTRMTLKSDKRKPTDTSTDTAITIRPSGQFGRRRRMSSIASRLARPTPAVIGLMWKVPRLVSRWRRVPASETSSDAPMPNRLPTWPTAISRATAHA